MTSALRRGGWQVRAALPLAAALAASLLSACSPPERAAVAPAVPVAVAPSHVEAVELSIVNAERARHGVAPLRSRRELDEVAEQHAADMLARGYFAHESPDGETVADRFQELGGSRWQMVAENISECSHCSAAVSVADLDEIHRGWMGHAGHRRNILDGSLTDFGFAIATDAAGRQVAVQTFAGPGSAPEVPPQLVTVSQRTMPGVGVGELLLQQQVNAARSAAGQPPLALSSGLSAAARLMLDRTARAAHGPDQDLGHFGIAGSIPESLQRPWRTLVMLASACGGCGSAVSDGDSLYFRDRWLADAANRRELLSGSFTHLGFAMMADGQGGKFAVAVLAR